MGPTIIWSTGDGANGSTDAKEVAKMVQLDEPDYFLYLGDIYESGTYTEFLHNYRSAYESLDRITFPTPGNHDWPNYETGYKIYFNWVQGSYYATNLDPHYTLISLNSEEDHKIGSRQHTWLRYQLDALEGRTPLVMWHRSRFSSGGHGDQEDLDPLWDMVKGRAPIVLTGHNHSYQRFAPIMRTTQFIVGAAGRARYAEVPQDNRLNAYDAANYGALRLELGPKTIKYSYHVLGNKILDEGIIENGAP